MNLSATPALVSLRSNYNPRVLNIPFSILLRVQIDMQKVYSAESVKFVLFRQSAEDHLCYLLHMVFCILQKCHDLSALQISKCTSMEIWYKWACCLQKVQGTKCINIFRIFVFFVYSSSLSQEFMI